MKHINFEVFLRKNFSLLRKIKKGILCEDIDLRIFDIELEIEEAGLLDQEDKKTICFIKDIIKFTILFIYNILQDNKSVKEEDAVYKIDINVKIDFKGKKLQIYYYLEDKIFGIIVGKQFQNVRNFIQACFPIIAKSEFKMEFRFFPISRK